MKTFDQFVARKGVGSLMESVARDIVELELNPWDVVINATKNQPSIHTALMEAHNRLEQTKQALLSEGFFGNLGSGLKKAGGVLGGWAKQMGQSGMQTAKVAGGAMRDAMKGPEMRYEQAITALQTLEKELLTNQQIRQIRMQHNEVDQLVTKLRDISRELQQQKEQIKQWLSYQTTGAKAVGAQGGVGMNTAAATPTQAAPTLAADTAPAVGG